MSGYFHHFFRLNQDLLLRYLFISARFGPLHYLKDPYPFCCWLCLGLLLFDPLSALGCKWAPVSQFWQVALVYALRQFCSLHGWFFVPVKSLHCSSRSSAVGCCHHRCRFSFGCQFSFSVQGTGEPRCRWLFQSWRETSQNETQTRILFWYCYFSF